MKNNQLIDKIKTVGVYSFLTLLFVFTCYTFRTSFLYLSAIITDDYQSLFRYINLVIYCIPEILFFFVCFHHFCIKKLSKISLVTYSIVELFLLNVFLIMFFMNIREYSSNFNEGIKSFNFIIFFPLGAFIMITISILAIVFVIKWYDNEILNIKRYFSHIGVIKYIFVVLLFFLSFYSCYNVILDLTITNNFYRYPFGYITLFLMFIVASIDVFFLVLKDDRKKHSIVNITCLSLNALVLILFLTAILIENNMMVYLSKPFGPLDFAGSFKILDIVYCVSFVFMIIYSSFVLFYNIRKEKRILNEK